MLKPRAGSGDSTIFDGKTHVLKRFYLVLALAALTAFTGMSTGFGLFFRLLYILGATVVLTLVWNWLSLLALEVKVERRSRRVSVSDDVEERVSIRNRSSFPRPVLEVEDLTDLPGYSSGAAIGLASRGYRSWRTLAPARKRGVYTMGPVRVVNTDAFGIFRRERFFGDTETLVVYPRIFELPDFAIPPANLSGEASARKRAYDLTPHAASVREYAVGDSISRVHWPSTARMDKLMSKEFDLGLSSDVWVLVDLDKDTQAGELDESTDEYAVSIAASLAKKYVERQLPFGLIAYGDRRYFLPSETGSRQFDQVMEFLAMSKAEGSVPVETALTREELLWGQHSTLIIITASPRKEWAVAVKQLMRRRVRVVVIVLDGRSFGTYFDSLEVVPELLAEGVTTYVVRRGDNVTVALSQVYTAADQGSSEEPAALEARA